MMNQKNTSCNKLYSLILPGINCEINFDDCASGPCEFGMCKDGINRYDCVCKPGFTGKSPKQND